MVFRFCQRRLNIPVGLSFAHIVRRCGIMSYVAELCVLPSCQAWLALVDAGALRFGKVRLGTKRPRRYSQHRLLVARPLDGRCRLHYRSRCGLCKNSGNVSDCLAGFKSAPPNTELFVVFARVASSRQAGISLYCFILICKQASQDETSPLCETRTCVARLLSSSFSLTLHFEESRCWRVQHGATSVGFCRASLAFWPAHVQLVAIQGALLYMSRGQRAPLCLGLVAVVIDSFILWI